jgi:hypothetical protein
MDAFQVAVKSIFSLSSDIAAIAGLTALFALVGLLFGKGKLVALILAFYPTGLLFKNLPFFKKFTTFSALSLQDTLTGLAIFLVLFGLIHYIINTFISADFSYSSIGKFFEACFLGLTATSIAILFSYQIINLAKIYNFSPSIDKLFAGDALFWWLLAPLGVLFIIRK